MGRTRLKTEAADASGLAGAAVDLPERHSQISHMKHRVVNELDEDRVLVAECLAMTACIS
jgi:hypothetical protein